MKIGANVAFWVLLKKRIKNEKEMYETQRTDLY